MTISIYVINLDRSTGRLREIRARLDAFGLPFERVPAFDGRQLDLATVADYDAQRTKRYLGRGLVGGEIGCYRSHLAAAARFLASDASYALVLEDDAVPKCDPVELLSIVIPDLERSDPDWLLMNVGNRSLKIATPLSRHPFGGVSYSLVAAHYFPMSTFAIVWSRRGAAAFVEGHEKIFAPVDNFFRHWLTREGHGYSISPPPVGTDHGVSEITAAVGEQRKRADRKWYYGISKNRRIVTDKIFAYYNKMRFKSEPLTRI